MLQIKLFTGGINVQHKVNQWLRDNEEKVIINDIKYSVVNNDCSVSNNICIVYHSSNSNDNKINEDDDTSENGIISKEDDNDDESDVSSDILDDDLENYSQEEIEAILRMKKKYPNGILLKTNPKTGRSIVPYEIAKDWD